MRLGRTAGTLLLLGGAWCSLGCEGASRQEAPQETQPVSVTLGEFSLTVRDSGFASPASVLHDAEADVYLVTNRNGEVGERDGDGFISRISPEGQVMELRWVDGVAPGTTLHSPRGMALVADTLFVADVNCLRRFHRLTGGPLPDLCMDRVGSMADVAATHEGNTYFTDQGSGEISGGVYLLRQRADVPQRVTLADGTVLAGPSIGGPAGVLANGRGLYFVTSRSGEAWRVTPRGEGVRIAPPWGVGLDGLVSLDGRGFLVSSHGDPAIFWIGPEGTVQTLLRPVSGPGDMGYDSIRKRILIPLPAEDAVLVRGVR